jgi:hypothetical protein
MINHPIRLLAVVVLLATGAGLAQAQTIGAGSIPSNPNFGFNPSPVALTAVDLAFPATGSGQMTSAAFVWSSAPCAATVKIKFFRRTGDTLIFVSERGPFDVTNTSNAVALTPPVPVQAGDLVGITRVANCGSPVGLNPGASAGLVAFGGDIVTSVSILSGTTAPISTLAVQATGTGTVTPSQEPAAIIPVVISSPGQQGANFRVAVQLHNPGATASAGKLVFHPQAVSGSASDPSLQFALAPGQTSFLGDVLASMGQSGIGSMDIVVSSGPTPFASVRVYNDLGIVLGTSGFTEPSFRPTDALAAGMRGIIISPFDLLLYRLNVGVRTLSTGASIVITVRDSSGTLLRTVSRSYAPNFFQQADAASFLGGVAIGVNQTITIDVVSGNLFLYGATADNRTNDSAVLFVQNIL